MKEDLTGRILKYIGSSSELPKYGDLFLVQSMENNGLLRLSDNSSGCHWNPENWEIVFELMIIPSTLGSTEKGYSSSLIKLLKELNIK